MRRKKSMLIVATIVLGGLVSEIWAARPTVSISSSPATIFNGGSSTLTWSSTGATSAYINQGIGSVPLNGSLSVSPTQTMIYTITVGNSSGYRRASASVKVYVYNTDPPTATISATPTSILQGGSATLNWSTTKAATVTIDNGIGTVAASGSKVVSPTVTTTYTLTVLHSSGYQVTAKATIEVIPIPPPTITLVADPDMLSPGASSTLTWTSANATSVTIDNGIGAVELNGSLIITPTQDTTFTAVATGVAGTAMATVSVRMLDTHLRSIWSGMKDAMISGNIDQAASFFDDETKASYLEIFNAISSQLPQLVASMRDIEPVYIGDGGAQFRIKRIEILAGNEYDVTYYIYFVRGEDGVWKILKY